MIVLKGKEDCCACSACVQICPKHCITISEDVEGFWYPQVNEQECVGCSLCESVCPIIKADNAEDITNTDFEKTATFAAINKNEDVRMNSSSGGVFTSLAEYVLEKGGVVFGAAFSSDFRNVSHIAICDKDSLKLLRGSKYVQSEIGNSYAEAERYLKDDRMVLYTGTPCQIAGLKTYLRKEYEKLICLDIICHGVPSPKVWRKYIQEQEKEFGGFTSSVTFRSKKTSWKTYEILLEFLNNNSYKKRYYEDLFMRTFLKDLSLRPSCYECRFKQVKRVSDITIADFWGIESIQSDMDDDKGTSLVIIHSEKGMDIWDKIGEMVISKKADLEEALKYNPSMTKSVKKNEHRDEFFADLDNKSFKALVKKYDKKKISLKQFIIKIVRKFGFGRNNHE